jgi:hypothetical protein
MRGTLPLLSLCGLLAACGGGGGGGSGSAPTPSSYSVSAIVSGLSGSGLTLSLNGGAAVAVNSNETVSLGSDLANGTSYSVAVSVQPTHPVQSCSVTEGSGTVENSNAAVQVSCATSAPSAQTATQVTLGSNISSTLSATIKQVATGWGTGSVGGWVPIALTDDTSDTVLFALDSNGRVVLGAMATSASTAMDANSTALTLVRMILANSSGTATTAELDKAIEGSAGYTNLVSLIEADLSEATRPLSDPKVASTLLSVASTAQAALPATSKVGAGRRSSRAKEALGTPTMTQEGLFPVIASADPNNPYFAISSLASTHTLIAHNAMAMPWSAQTFAASANSGTPSSPLGPVVPVPAQTIYSGQEIASLPMANSPFNFVLSQDQDSLNAIALDFAKNLTDTTIDLVLNLAGSNCKTQLIAAVGKITSISVADGGTFEATEDALMDVLDADTVNSLFKECAKSGVPLSAALVYTAIEDTFLELMSTALGYANIAANANQILQEAWYANKFWDKTYTVGVCAAQDYSINSCVASFQFYPAQLVMMPGADASVTVTGLDADGKGTLLPGDLTVTPSDPAVVDVTGTAPFKVTATTIGTSQIDVMDPSTGATNDTPAANAAPFPVNVVSPTLIPSAATLVASSSDQTLTVSLQGPNGETACTAALLEPCLSVTSDVKWDATVTNTSVNAVTVSGPIGTWTLPANAGAGTIAITASADGNTYGPANVTVTANPWVGIWDGTITSTCGTYAGPGTADVTAVGSNQISFNLDTNIGDFDWILTVSGNTATGSLDDNTSTCTLDGDTITCVSPPSCQTSTYMRATGSSASKIIRGEHPGAVRYR